MMRLLFATALTGALSACQTFEIGTDRRDELTRALDFQQNLENRDAAGLLAEASDLRDELQQNADAPAATQLRLVLLESRIELLQLRQANDAQEQQIRALQAQIEELTAIEQQINRRGQEQETVNE